jgi:hypothetical protein
MSLKGIKLQVPRLLTICPQFHTIKPGPQARMRKDVREAMNRPDGSIHSRSGMAAALAINWCEERGEPYSVQAVPGAGYIVKREVRT